MQLCQMALATGSRFVAVSCSCRMRYAESAPSSYFSQRCWISSHLRAMSPGDCVCPEAVIRVVMTMVAVIRVRFMTFDFDYSWTYAICPYFVRLVPSGLLKEYCKLLLFQQEA